MEMVGGDGVTPGVSQHLGLGQTPRAVHRRGSPPLCRQPPPGQLSLHGEGQPGSRQQDMPLTRKLSKQAAPLVCSPARWRILFHVPSLLPPAHSPPRGCSGASKPPLGQGIQGIASARSHEGIVDGSGLRQRSPPAELTLPRSPTRRWEATHRQRLGQAARARSRGGPGPHGATSSTSAGGGGDGLAQPPPVSAQSPAGDAAGGTRELSSPRWVIP